jgi:hypothetical protein
MYQVFCLKNTPPVTAEEQEKCFRSKTLCWRLAEKQRTSTSTRKTTEEETPVTAHRAR